VYTTVTSKFISNKKLKTTNIQHQTKLNATNYFKKLPNQKYPSLSSNMEQKLQQLAKLVNDEKLPCSKAQKMLADIQVSLESMIMNSSDHRSLLVHVDE